MKLNTNQRTTKLDHWHMYFQKEYLPLVVDMWETHSRGYHSESFTRHWIIARDAPPEEVKIEPRRHGGNLDDHENQRNISLLKKVMQVLKVPYDLEVRYITNTKQNAYIRHGEDDVKEYVTNDYDGSKELQILRDQITKGLFTSMEDVLEFVNLQLCDRVPDQWMDQIPIRKMNDEESGIVMKWRMEDQNRRYLGRP